jgi:hypothetical protein
VYVGAESADLLHRIRFGPEGTVVEKTIGVGELAAEMEGPHGLAISRDGQYLHLTTGHGFPDGKYWRYHLVAVRNESGQLSDFREAHRVRQCPNVCLHGKRHILARPLGRERVASPVPETRRVDEHPTRLCAANMRNVLRS